MESRVQGVMRRFVPAAIVAALAVAVAGLVWAAAYRERASQAEVTRAVYAAFGPGPRIICAAQDENGALWYCRSAPRWGDDPACRQTAVTILGAIHVSRHTVVCEGA